MYLFFLHSTYITNTNYAHTLQTRRQNRHNRQHRTHTAIDETAVLCMHVYAWACICAYRSCVDMWRKLYVYLLYSGQYVCMFGVCVWCMHLKYSFMVCGVKIFGASVLNGPCTVHLCNES